ncbi:MAG: carboxylesterase family protein [Pseudomonadota bacterium]
MRPLKAFGRAAAGIAALAAAACERGADEETPRAPDQSTERRVSAEQTIVGYVDESGAAVWRGVRFADTTAGDNRWRAPRPPKAAPGLTRALEDPDRCPQLTNAFNAPGGEPGRLTGDEDCLKMNIFAPPDAEGAPVMVFIHGGGNVWGGAGDFDGARLAANENVVVVMPQYRLGPLGFFAFDALQEAARDAAADGDPDDAGSNAPPRDAAANFALLDLIAALEWVRDNVDAFGGDPERVTIFGHSAGGRNVAALLASPLAKGLFHRAIVQSGNFTSTNMADARGDEPGAENSGRVIARRLGARTPGDLRASLLPSIFAAYEPNDGGFFELPQMVEDGVTLPAAPLREAVTGPDASDVPIVLGVTRDEMKLFFALEEAMSKRLFGVFPTPRDPVIYEATARYTSRAWRVLGVDEPARRLVDAGREVYAYRFDWDEGGRIFFTDFKVMIGAAHAMELPFVFDRFALLGFADRFMFQRRTRVAREELASVMGEYWSSFAAAGVPTAEGAPAWPTYGAEGRVLRLDTPVSNGGIDVMTGGDSIERIVSDLQADDALSAATKCDIALRISLWAPRLTATFSDAFDCS